MDNRSNHRETSKSLASNHSRSAPNSKYRQKKRKPPQIVNENELYVTSGNYQAHLKKALKLFESGAREVTIHGLGAAVIQAANLSLQVAEKLNNTVVLSTNTDTVELLDDWEPFADDDLPYTTKRLGSALHIKITRHPDIPS